jgi:hypothetical protein
MHELVLTICVVLSGEPSCVEGTAQRQLETREACEAFLEEQRPLVPRIAVESLGLPPGLPFGYRLECRAAGTPA